MSLDLIGWTLILVAALVLYALIRRDHIRSLYTIALDIRLQYLQYFRLTENETAHKIMELRSLKAVAPPSSREVFASSLTALRELSSSDPESIAEAIKSACDLIVKLVDGGGIATEQGTAAKKVVSAWQLLLPIVEELHLDLDENEEEERSESKAPKKDAEYVEHILGQNEIDLEQVVEVLVSALVILGARYQFRQ